MHIIIPVASLTMLALAAATFYLLRSLFGRRRLADEGSSGQEPCWRDYRPLHRLLDPADFDFLRRRGVSESRIKRLRAERLRIYRLCLCSLASDFNQVQSAIQLVMVQSRVDRPQLAAELAKQKLTFYRNFVKAEFRLMLCGWGFDRMPAIDLLQPLEILQSQLQQMAVAGAAA